MNHDDQPQDAWDPFDPKNRPDQARTPPASGYTAPTAPQPTTVFCIQCGYNLTSIAIGSTCPECGRPVAPSFHGQTLPTSGKAVTSLILGILSLPMCFCFGLPAVLLGISAIVFAIVAKKDVSAGRVGGASSGMAIAGLICGIIGLCMGLIVIGMILGGNQSGSGSPSGP